MAMKKKFLGLALAAAIALPATGVYAAETASQNVGYKNVESDRANDTETSTTIDVNGEVLNANNQSGKIQVEIPTAMAFTVRANSTVDGPDYKVTNLGSNSIDISVSSFEPDAGSNIFIKTAEEIEQDTTTASGVASNAKLTRNYVSLTLNGSGGKKVDLGAVNQGVASTNKELATIAPSGVETITLTGAAGIKPDESGIDKTGTNGSFKLAFKITKAQP